MYLISVCPNLFVIPVYIAIEVIKIKIKINFEILSSGIGKK